MKNLLLLVLFVGSFLSYSQQNVKAKKLQVTESAVVGGTSKDASAVMDIQSTDKGVLLPRLTQVQVDAILNPAEGLIVYNTTESGFQQYDGVSWVSLGGSGGIGTQDQVLSANRTLDLNSYSLSILNDSLSLKIDSLANLYGSYDSLRLFSIEKIDTTAAEIELYKDTVPNIRLRSDTNSFIVKGLTIGDTIVDNSAIVNLVSTDKGFLIPRMTTTERDAIVSPTTSLMLYNTTDSEFQFYDGASWAPVSGVSSNFANTDLTLDGNRTHDLNGNTLTFVQPDSPGTTWDLVSNQTNTVANLYTKVANYGGTQNWYIGKDPGLNNTDQRLGIEYVQSGRFSIYNEIDGAGFRVNLDNNLTNIYGFQIYRNSLNRGWALHDFSAGIDVINISSVNQNVAIGIDSEDNNSILAKLHVKGEGSTNATTAFLVENSSGTELLKILDDGTVTPNLAGNTIYSGDDVLTGDRNVTLNGNTLDFVGPIRENLRLTDDGDVQVLNSTANRGLLVASGGVTSNYIRLEAYSNAAFIHSLNSIRITSGALRSATFLPGKIGVRNDSPVASLHVRSLGSTVSTQAFAVENSSLSSAFIVRDDLTSDFFGNVTTTGQLTAGTDYGNTPTTNAFDYDCDLGVTQKLDLQGATATVSVTFSNPKEGNTYMLIVEQGTNLGDLTLPSGWYTNASPPYDFTTLADNERAMVTATYIDTEWYYSVNKLTLN